MTYNIYPSQIPLGKILGEFFLLNIIYIYIKTFKLIDIFLIIFLIVSNLIAVIKSTDSQITIENILFFSSTILTLWKCADTKFQLNMIKVIDSYNRYILYFYKSIITFTIIALFISSSYKFVNGSKLFYGFAQSGHKFIWKYVFINDALIVLFL